MNGKLIPFGYAVPDARARLEALMADPNTTLFDVRTSPRSRWQPFFNESSLRKQQWGNRYRYIGQWPGNANYNKSLPIQLVNEREGILLLRLTLQQGRNVVLLCACRAYEACHRRVIVEKLQAVLPEVEVMREVSL